MFPTPVIDEFVEQNYDKHYEFVYVSAPFSAYPYHTKEENIAKVREYCKFIRAANDKYIPIAPQIYLGQFMPDEDKEDYDEALRVCIRMMDMCSKVFVFDDKGYISKGMKAEIEFAAKMGTKVVFMELKTDEGVSK